MVEKQFLIIEGVSMSLELFPGSCWKSDHLINRKKSNFKRIGSWFTRLSALLNKKHIVYLNYNGINQSESHLKYRLFKIKKGVSIILKWLLSMILKLQEIFFDPALFLLAYWKLSRAESSKVIRGQVNLNEKHFILWH